MVDPKTILRFDEIYNSTNKAVLSFITARCKNTADIHDIFQDTYIELYKLLSRRGVGYITNDKALIMRIAKRKIARYYSFMERVRMVSSLNPKNDDEEVEILDLIVENFDMEEFTANRLILEKAKQYIKSKPDEIKKVFYLFYSVDLTIAEIAAELSISESSVKNKLYRTLKELKNLLQREVV